MQTFGMGFGGIGRRLTFVGAAYGSDTITLPTHMAGDYVFVQALGLSASTPSLGTGYSPLANGSISATYPMRYRMGYRKAIAAGEACGGWTDADYSAAYVFRGIGSIGSPLTDTGATLDFKALALSRPGRSYVLAMAASWGVGIGATDAPSGMVNVASNTSSVKRVAHWTGIPVSAWTLQQIGGLDSDSSHVCLVIEAVPI